MSLRDIRQQEFAELWLNSKRFSIMYLAPRFGKIFTSINILKQLNPHCTLLIAYPDNKIRHSWEEDFKKRNYTNPNVTFVTHLSLKKYVDKIFDIIILDEIHLLSEAQIDVCKKLFKENKTILGLTGTMSQETKNTLWNELKLPVLATYSIEQAIEEGVIADYEISVIKVPLDRGLKLYKDKSEKQKFDSISWVIDKFEEEEKDTFFLRLQRMRIIQNSVAKLNKTKQLLQIYKEERVLAFMGNIKMCEDLNISTYHSKSSEKEVFDNFVNGAGKSLAVCKIGNTGVTYKNLNYVIINYFSSNGEDMIQKLMRALSWEYNNPNKKAKIIIITSDETIESKWLAKAIFLLDQSKIKYI